MRVMALLWHIDGKDHCLVDTVNDANLTERHRLFVENFPGNRARLVSVEIPDADPTAPTLPPGVDPFSEAALKTVAPQFDDATAYRGTLPTLPETLVERDRELNRTSLRAQDAIIRRLHDERGLLITQRRLGLMNPIQEERLDQLEAAIDMREEQKHRELVRLRGNERAAVESLSGGTADEDGEVPR